MRRKLFVLLTTLFIYTINSTLVFADIKEKSSPLEEFYPEVGYKAMEEAVKDFEEHFKLDLKLPLRIPPLEFTHYFGRFNDLDGEINDSLEVVFINEQKPINQYTIDVRPIKHKIPFKGVRDRYIKQIFVLNNGREALLIANPSSEVLVFEYNNLQYMLSVNKTVSKKITPDILIQIANTIK
ncbi:hypothetical protein [Cytobacillus horneckiae]|uniref:hypothetical protein n=1 Tax=Cytobacillus horneckiae TaxID=549687 RepID=UPI003D9A21A1